MTLEKPYSINNRFEGVAYWVVDPPMDMQIDEEDQKNYLIANVRLEHCNQTFASMHGRHKPEELKYSKLGALYSEGYNLNRLVSVLVANNYSVSNFESREKFEGETKWFLNYCEPTFLDNKLVALKSTQIDITRQKELENAYYKTESHLFSVLENSKDIILSVDREYNLLSINKAGNQTFKASLNIDVKPGDNIIKLIPPALAESWKRRYDRALAGERFSEEEYYKDESGELYFELSIYPVYENDEIIAATVISRDITVRKLHELRLVEGERNYRNLAIEKEELLQNLRDYTSELSHVLRRPVSNLLAFSDQLQKGFIKDHDIEKSVSMIKTETKALDDIIHELTERLEKSKGQ